MHGLNYHASIRHLRVDETLAELGIKPSISEKLVPAMETICGPASEIHNMPFEIHTEMVARAILKADLMGEALKG